MVGLSGGYIDDVLRSDLPLFRSLLKLINERFQMVEDESIPFKFSGSHLERDKDGMLQQNQNEYLKCLVKILLDVTFIEFMSIR